MYQKVVGTCLAILMCVTCFSTVGCNPNEGIVVVEKKSEDVQPKLDTILGDYNNGRCGQDEASRRIEEVADGNPDANQIVDGARDDLALLSESKTIYEQAERYMTEGNYLLAFKLFGQVYSADSLYGNAQIRKAEAQSFIVDKAKNEAGAAAASGDYWGAVAILQSCKNDIGEITELNSLITVYQEDATRKEVSSVLDKASEKIAERDFSAALVILNDALSKHSDNETLTALKADCEGLYVDYTLNFAKQCYDNEFDYTGAIAIINAALEDLPNNAELKKAKADYADCKPTELYELNSFYDDEGHVAFYDKQETDNCENTYQSYYRVILYNFGRKALTVYKIDGNYDFIAGTIFLPEKSKSDERGGRIRIYGDDVLLFDSGTVCRGVEPIKFNVNISGVVQLRIEGIREGDSSWGPVPYLSNVQLFKKMK